ETRSVKPITVRSLVPDGVLDPGADLAGYGFCPNPACPVVYSQRSGGKQVRQADLRVEVFQKSLSPGRAVCYCFGHSVEDVQRDATSAEPAICEEMQGRCRGGLDTCEGENPQGRCCLANVRAVAREVPAAAAPVSEPRE